MRLWFDTNALWRKFSEDDPGTRVVCDEGGQEWRPLREAGRVLGWSEAHAWLEELPPT